MELLSLQMRNFKRYRHQDVVFRDGITGIVGNNGTGKSTIVEAILFCLYGVKETGLDHILSATAGPRERAEVRLDFSVHGEEFQILRSLGPRKKHDARLHRGGKLMAKGVSEVQDAVRRIVRMGQSDFRHTIFSGQKELLTLLDATPEERKRWFRRVLGIDSLKETGGEILRKEAMAAREQLLAIEGRIADVDPGAIRAEEEDLERRIARSEETLRSLGEELEGIEAHRGSLEAEISGLRDREKELLRLHAMIRNLEEEQARVLDELAGINREIQALGKEREEFKTLSASEPGFEILRDRLEASRAGSYRFQTLQAEEDRTRGLLDGVLKALEDLRNEESSLVKDEERQKALGPAITRRAGIQARLGQIGSLEERYRTLLAAIAKKDEALSAAAERGARIRSRMESIQAARARLGELLEPYGKGAPAGADPVVMLEDREKELLGTLAELSAARDRAAETLGKLEHDLAVLGARGTEGDCPLCRQPLGIRYREIVDGLQGDIDRERSIISGAEVAWKQAEEEMAALSATLAEARRLREVCNRMGEVTAEWEAVQDLSRKELTGRERLEKEMHALAYDPKERQRLEAEVAALDGPREEHVAISERLKRRPSLVRTLQETTERMERLKEGLAGISRDRGELGFDPGGHARLEEECRIAEERHRRFLGMKPGMDRLPFLEDRATDLARKEKDAVEALVRMRAAAGEIPFSREDLARREAELRSVLDQVLVRTQEAAGCRADLVHLADDKRRMGDLLQKFELDRREHDRLKEEMGMLDLTREHLTGFTDHLLGVVRGQIQEETGRVLAEITDGRYDTVILDDAFDLLVHDLGGDFPVSRFSGGEQDDVAIALRIALSRYIAEMHELHDSTFLIFDEIFGSQDEERRGNIFRALRALEPYFPQILLISHVTDVQGEFGNTLVVEAVSGTESRIRDLEGAAA
jgi:DNA repair exonuclease SbcCD ATPase subunit